MAENKEENQKDLIDLFEKKLDLSSDFPFLIDKQSMEFVRNSQIMFIARGLPGSGKSTLTKKITNLYPDAVVCAGDDFFTDKDGNYNFDASKLHEAHEAARTKAYNACRDLVSPVVVDNTNVTFWEVNNYVKIAKQFNYIYMMIEPRTGHKFDADKLFQYNKHNVPKETIELKLHKFDVLIPIYFGLFLNQKDSRFLTGLCKDLYVEILDKCPFFKYCFDEETDLKTLFEYRNESKLHLTTKYFGRAKNIDDEYLKNPYTSLSVGKCFDLKIVGFSVTPTTFAAAIELDHKTLRDLWDNDLEEEKLQELFNDESFENINDKQGILNELGFAARAHITVGLAKGISPVKSGVDLLKIKLKLKLAEKLNEKRQKVKTDKFELNYLLNDSFCFVKLNEPLRVKTLFTYEL